MIDDDRLFALGRALAAAQDQGRADDPAEVRAAVRERLLAQAAAAPSRAPRTASIAIGFAVALAAVLTLWVAWPWHQLTFAVGREREPGVAGAWLSTPDATTQSLQFSDGSVIDLRAGSRARVVQLHGDGAQVVIEAGAALVAIVPRSQSRWRIDAGPYLVDVTGTRFDIGWDPSTEVFELTLHEGSVTVRGPGIDGHRTVAAGESVRIGEAEAPAQLAALAVPTTPALPEAEPATPSPVVASAEPRVVGKARAGARARVDAKSGDEDGWRALAERASYREALAAAEAADFAGLCASLSSKDLLRLADVARFARRPDRATEALVAARERFPDTDAAAMAAFERGRMAFARGAHPEAAKWFGVYLAERPQGSIAREATGRMMEAQHEAGRDRDAALLAARYLARWPEGPDADLARRLQGAATSEATP